MLALVGPDDALYKLVVTLHIAAVIVGFGPYTLLGILGKELATADAASAGPLAAARKRMATVAEGAIYAVPILGVLAILLSDDIVEFSAPWISASLTVYVLALAVLLAVAKPAQRRLDGMADHDGSAGERGNLQGKLGVATGVVNLAWVITLVLMVFKPGQ